MEDNKEELTAIKFIKEIDEDGKEWSEDTELLASYFEDYAKIKLSCHLQKKDRGAEAVEFVDVFEFNNWVKKYAVPDHANGVDKWQTWSKRNLTVKELYKEYLKTKNK